MSSSLLFDFREIIEPARICSSSYPRGVAPGSCTAPRTSAPDKLLCAPASPTPTISIRLSSSGTVLTSGADLSYFGGHICCSLHMWWCTSSLRTHAQPLVANTIIDAWHDIYLAPRCIVFWSRLRLEWCCIDVCLSLSLGWAWRWYFHIHRVKISHSLKFI